MYNYFDPLQQSYQQRLNEMQRQYMPQTPPMPKVRVVTSIEEAKAAQIDLDGTPTFFRSPAEGKIYEKSIGLDGLPVFNVYTKVNMPQTQSGDTSLQALANRLTRLEYLMKGNNNESNAVTSANGTSAV